MLPCQDNPRQVIVGGREVTLCDCRLIQQEYGVRFGVGADACARCQAKPEYAEWRKECAVMAYVGRIVRDPPEGKPDIGRSESFARLAKLDPAKTKGAVLAAIAAETIDRDAAEKLLSSAGLAITDEDVTAATARAKTSDPRSVAVEPTAFVGPCQDRRPTGRIWCRKIRDATQGIIVGVHDGICRRCRGEGWWPGEARRCLAESIANPYGNLPERTGPADDLPALLDCRVRALLDLAGPQGTAEAIATAYTGGQTPHGLGSLRRVAERFDLLGEEVADEAR